MAEMQHVVMQSYDTRDQTSGALPYSYATLASDSGFPTRQPRDYVVWSLFNFCFFNACCLGFIALLYSFKSRDRKVVGDAEAATRYGNTAKNLNIAAVVLSIVFIILIIIIPAVIVFQLSYQTYNVNYSSFEDYFKKNGK
ncbi:dispanin subfamily A member 2b-like isoform X1 [Sphaerodactylus townsendi]|uniref:Uncharacterized protein n=1 Tax=Sphaerodactylus townsendi TaxID=933632 RepID=A0ACB8G333_9SAUR|nr:dispanin subfamily A member 2b-like isoform X1 [Sphaerodactylus townsendi]